MHGKRPKNYPKSFKPTNWYVGERVDIAVGDDFRNLSEYRGIVSVAIRDRKTGKIEYRAGDTRMIGNFSPIWISWKGERVLIEELLRR